MRKKNFGSHFAQHFFYSSSVLISMRSGRHKTAAKGTRCLGERDTCVLYQTKVNTFPHFISIPGEGTQQGRIATLNLLDPLYDKIETYGLRVTNTGQGLLICAAEAGGTEPHSVLPSWDFKIRP